MKTKLLMISAVLFALSLPMSAMAANGHNDHDSHDSHDSHGEHADQGHDAHDQHDDHAGHEGMSAEGDMVVVGSVTEKGVKAMAHMKDVREAMADMGMNITHHFMVAFVDEQSGDQIEEGMAALKFEGPQGTTEGPIKMMGMEGHFGADIELEHPGHYKLKVGTKLADGEKRQFEFSYELK
ncbi:hypothetical protein [Geoalkalibacter subterraneus]|uniref:YtkA-like domain-containing protein n=1 Tax=Geoalkalibacter subterraneus TaxID=483547 RepID=A0A0B5FR98_9BACT|nr:hypothetical protein [Geoalkalibacter subterraneus]AJF06645.1 hypothetical protein GSUB_08950 [Geoalkalibacter subterraneus]